MNKGRIILGLFIFVIIATFPFLVNQGKASAGPDINLNTPAIAAGGECIESAEYMKANHMQMLLDWRDEAVREGKQVYVNSQGKEFEISLQNTCMECHSDNDAFTANAIPTATDVTTPNNFCFSCHDYASVEPDCWSCHLDPREAL